MRSFDVPALGRPLWVLLSGILFTHFGLYMILPFLAIVLSTQRGLTFTEVGLVLGAGSISYLIGSIVGGQMADRIGKRTAIVTGLLLRAVGFAGYAFVHPLGLLFATSVVSGIGGGMYTPPAKAGIAFYASGGGNKTTAFSYRGIAANIGTMTGPLIGAWLMTRSVVVLFLLAAVIYVGLAVAHAWLLGSDAVPATSNPSTTGSYRQVLSDSPYLVFSGLAVLIWALFTQFTLALPLRATEILPGSNSIGWIWSVTSVLVILLQAPITRLSSARLHPLSMLAVGLFIMAIGLGSVAYSTGFYHLLFSAIVFTVGEMFIMPTVDTIVSELANPLWVGSYFGVAALVFGLGEALGNMGGGRLMDYAARQNMLALPWGIYFVTGMVVAGLAYALRSWKRLAGPLAGEVEKRNQMTFSPLMDDSAKKSSDRSKSKAP